MKAVFLPLALIFHISVLWFSFFKGWIFQLNEFINPARTIQAVPTKIHLRKMHLVYEEFEFPVCYKNTFWFLCTKKCSVSPQVLVLGTRYSVLHGCFFLGSQHCKHLGLSWSGFHWAMQLWAAVCVGRTEVALTDRAVWRWLVRACSKTTFNCRIMCNYLHVKSSTW